VVAVVGPSRRKRDEARKTDVPEEKGSVEAYVYIRNGRRQTAILLTDAII
jgi:hypothetical protein